MLMAVKGPLRCQIPGRAFRAGCLTLLVDMVGDWECDCASGAMLGYTPFCVERMRSDTQQGRSQYP